LRVIKGYKKFFDNKWVNGIVLASALLLLPFWFFCLPELVKMGYGELFWSFFEARPALIRLSGYLIVAIIYAFLILVFRKLAISTLVLGLFCFFLGYANYYKLMYRDEPVFPSDAFQIKDAVMVAGTDIDVSFSAGMWLQIAVIILLSALLWFVRLPSALALKKAAANKKAFIKKLAVNVTALLLIAACFVSMFAFVFFDSSAMKALGFRSDLIASRVYYRNMFFPSFCIMAQYLFPEKPDGYTEQTMLDIAADMRGSAVSGAKKADVIVVVEESWFELSNYEGVFTPDPMQNYRRLAEEGVTGNIVSPKYGGGTADIEYEVLTGLTTNDNLTNTTAFTINLYDEYPSIVNYFKTNGYGTYALHSYTNEIYNRVNAYPDLGFDNINFMDTIKDPEMSGPWVKDSSAFKKLIELYEEGIQENDRVVVHTLTMQNHVPHNDDRYSEEEKIDVQADTYDPTYWAVIPTAATTLHEIDQAIGELIDYFREVERDVIVIILGDHQSPLRIDNNTDALTTSGFYDTYVEGRDFLKLHTTPYLVWANFETGNAGTTYGNIPPNMLIPRALDSYDIIRPAYFQYLLENSKSMNGMTSDYVVNPDGSVSFQKTPQQQAEADLRMLVQYDIIYGKKYLRDSWY
jgi:phosphoglycerol transferase MdoB-like AlkP superfamily enzyme